MFVSLVYDSKVRGKKPQIQLAHNLMKSFIHFHPDVPHSLYTFSVSEKEVAAMRQDGINVVEDVMRYDAERTFIYRSELVACMIREWRWAILIDTDCLVRKPIDGLIELAQSSEPMMAAFERPIKSQGWNCGVMAMNYQAEEALRFWGNLQYEEYDRLSKLGKEYPLCYEQTAWIQAAQEFGIKLTDYGKEYNDMPERADRGGNGNFGDGAIWHSKGKYSSDIWKRETSLST